MGPVARGASHMYAGNLRTVYADCIDSRQILLSDNGQVLVSGCAVGAKPASLFTIAMLLVCEIYC